MVRKLILVWFICLFTMGCTYVEPGYVGIKVNSYGTQKGVQDFPLQTGRVCYNPFTETIYKYPTFMQSKVWTDDVNEDNMVREGITYSSMEGATIESDVSINYTLDPQKVPHLFVEFRQPIEALTHTYLRTQVRDAFNRCAGQFKAVEIFGMRKQELLDAVKAHLNEHLTPKGFIIDNVSFVGAPHADPQVMQSINNVIQATQDAIKAENKVRQIKAEAQQAIETAKGDAESKLTRAKAEAEANIEIAKSITPELVKYQALQKWDGVAPRVVGSGSTVLFGVDGK